MASLKAARKFASPLYVGRPNIGNRERLSERINELLDRRWLTNDGPLVQEFEQRVAEYLGVKHCVAMCNATVALEIVIRALNLKGEVIVPSFTFVATAHALQWQEITPVFCDIDPATHNLDPGCVERLITPRTTGIIGVHVWGNPCDVASLSEIAQCRGLTLLFDAAHAFGCSYDRQLIGGFGAAEVFSFHATKFVSSGEGGAVATNDDALADKIRLMRNFGFAGYDKVVYVGTNGKMSELSAALGLTSLESIETFGDRNRQNYAAYQHEFSSVAGVRLLPYGPRESHNHQYVVVELDSRAAELCRDELVQILNAENVLARRYFYPGCHRMEPYRSYYPNSGLLLPQTEALCERVLQLPTGTAVSIADIRTIAEIVRSALSDPGGARRQLQAGPQPAAPHDQE